VTCLTASPSAATPVEYGLSVALLTAFRPAAAVRN
jgi:hypothetical protein